MNKQRRSTRDGGRTLRLYCQGLDVLMNHGGNLVAALPKIRGLFNRSGVDRTQISLPDFTETLCLAFHRRMRHAN